MLRGVKSGLTGKPKSVTQQHSSTCERRSSLAQRKRDSRKAQNKRISDAVRVAARQERVAGPLPGRTMEEQQLGTADSAPMAQAQPARGPCETPAPQPASEHGDAADQHAEASQVLESMQHGQGHGGTAGRGPCRMQMMLTSLCSLQRQTIQSSMQACVSPVAVKPSGRQPPGHEHHTTSQDP